jgi:hypothetical protein
LKIGVLFKSGVEKIFSVRSIDTDVNWDTGKLDAISWEDLSASFAMRGDNLPEFIDPNEVAAVWKECT